MLKVTKYIREERSAAETNGVSIKPEYSWLLADTQHEDIHLKERK
jgi:hypothetical protein